MRTINYRKPKVIANRSVLSGRVKIQVVDQFGALIEDRPWQKNLILDQGLNQVCNGTAVLATCFAACAVGTGTTPTYYDSGAVTVTISAGVATASAAFFNSGMNGMLLVTDDGTEQYMTFVNTTTANVTGSNSATSQLFTVWAVNQTGLTTEVKRTTTYLTGSGNCGTTSTLMTATRVLKRTFDFSAEVSPQNYTELGWSYTGSAGSNLFSRVLISGGTVSVLASHQLRVIYELTVVIAPATSRAETAPITGWPVSPATDTDGDYLACASGFSGNSASSTSGVGTNGSSSITGALEPSSVPVPTLCSGSTMPSFGSTFTRGTATNASTSVLQSYTPGLFYRDLIGTWTAASADRTNIRALLWWDVDGDAAVFIFDQAQTKDDEHLLEITWRRYVSRTITNP